MSLPRCHFVLPSSPFQLQNLWLKILVYFLLQGPACHLPFQEIPEMDPGKQGEYHSQVSEHSL